ncbi:MAG: hypothetical protein GXY77_19165 [Fibrobacter sp.]|nr:hypothetical protein [Fibrobacter sp.]
MKTGCHSIIITATVLISLTFSVFSEDTLNFSESVKEYNGCSHETALSIENAHVTISDNLLYTFLFDITGLSDWNACSQTESR